MGRWRESFMSQLQKNLVAVISLTVALSGLAYNTWRNETTERQRNVRLAAFEVVSSLGELQQTVHLLTYGGQNSDTLGISGWGQAELIRDLSPLVSPASGEEAKTLFEYWQSHVYELDGWRSPQADKAQQAREAERVLSKQISSLRHQVLSTLNGLE